MQGACADQELLLWHAQLRLLQRQICWREMEDGLHVSWCRVPQVKSLGVGNQPGSAVGFLARKHLLLKLVLVPPRQAAHQDCKAGVGLCASCQEAVLLKEAQMQRYVCCLYLLLWAVCFQERAACECWLLGRSAVLSCAAEAVLLCAL